MVPTRRLARLERENRRMKVGLGLVTVALAGVLFVAAGQDEKPRPVEEAATRTDFPFRPRSISPPRCENMRTNLCSL